VSGSWVTLPIKRVAHEVTQKEESLPSGSVYVGLENLESWTGRLIGLHQPVEPTGAVSVYRKGDVLFGKLRPYLAKSFVAPFDGAGTSEFVVFRPSSDIHPRFLNYFFLTPAFVEAVNASTYGAKMPRASDDFIASYPISLPQRAAQDRIVDFLDRETAKIDSLIAEKERLLQVLEERRQALITQAVTRGLDPSVPMKDSGLPWLGTIPSHWCIKRTRWLFRERDERSVSGEEELLTVSHLTGVTARSEKEVTMFMAESLEDYKVCHVNDLVINTMWAWMGAMGVSWIHGVCSPSYNVYEPNRSLLNPEFVDMLCRTPTFVQEATRFSKGVWSSRLRLYPDGFFLIWLPVPPLTEQDEIVAGIRHEVASMSKIKANATRTIATLSALRQATIHEAISGGAAAE